MPTSAMARLRSMASMRSMRSMRIRKTYSRAGRVIPLNGQASVPAAVPVPDNPAVQEQSAQSPRAKNLVSRIRQRKFLFVLPRRIKQSTKSKSQQNPDTQNFERIEQKFDVAYTREQMAMVSLHNSTDQTRKAEGSVHEKIDDFEYATFVQAHSPNWQRELDSLARAHEKDSTDDVQSTSIVRVAEDIVACLQTSHPTAEGEPFAAAVVLFHPCDRTLLKVFAASPDCDFPRSFTFDERHLPSKEDASRRKACIETWHVMHSGTGSLRSPFGSREIHGHSVMPLHEMNGRCFGVLL